MGEDIREVVTDVLVIGSGGAALRAVLSAQDGGAEVLVVIKGEFRRSGATFHSVAEVGAFNVPDGAGDPADDPDVFLADMLTAGQGMSDHRLSGILAAEAEDALRYLEGYGVHFERSEDTGRYLTYQACFSSKSRSHVIKDHFKPIVKALGTEASRRGVRVMDRLMVVDLIVRDGACLGAYALADDGATVVIRAKATIMTTGGASQLFATNLYPSDITGDGYAMAWRAGAHLANMEFMQAGVSLIHPFVNLFGNYLWDAAPRLADRDGRPFVADYLPEGLIVAEVLAEKQRHFPFSSSDISRYVEISIQKAINEGRATEKGGVHLDFIGCDFDRLLADKSRSFGRMWAMTYHWHKEKGADLYADTVQIACSAHAVNGGLRIDEDAESNIKGLFAAGEVAAGPHGADRLGGNMSVTCQVFGGRAGRAAAARAKAVGHPAVDAHDAHRGFLAAFAGQGALDLAVLRRELQERANRSLLILRSAAGLSDFRAFCAEAKQRLRQESRIETAEDRVRALELNNLIEVGDMMALAALNRPESRGSHYREDFPMVDRSLETNIVIDQSAPDGFIRARLADL
ncbi:FAD-binding protein [Methylopila sp. 73B]|uniref:FAD-binding protein n=1 Tax=Methylopila sp. 73B TaxID=1120792 RepID=UPI00035E9A32|nr:FAD-binding protein [Methylopila sp. 73B]